MRKLPNWIAATLKGAGILHFLLAGGLVFFSDSILETLTQEDMELSGSALWLQITGIGLATLGLGYLIASFNTLRNSVALFMGMGAMFSGLVLLPLHFGLAVFTHAFLAAGMAFMLSYTGLLIWMLYGIHKAGQAPAPLSHSYSEPLSKTLNRFRTQRGKSLLQLSNEQPVLVIFLHRFKNASCRRLLTDILHKQESIENRGTRLVFVHLSSENKAASFFKKAGLENEHRISDPNGIMYQAFELEKAVFNQNADWRSFLKQGISIMSLNKGKGAVHNMPGAFLINRSKIVKSYRHGQTTESPDFLFLASFEAA